MAAYEDLLSSAVTYLDKMILPLRRCSPEPRAALAATYRNS
jgi:hypothetical protein